MNLSQRLKHGKSLCGKVFAGFVETFNALVDFKDNLKGDDDVSRGNGHIRLDRTNPRFPIIRCSGCGAQPSGYNGGAKSAFEPVFDANHRLSSVGPGLWPYGRKFSPAVTVDSSAKVSDGFLGLEITHKTSSAEASAKIVMIDTGLVAITNTDLQKTTIPLYVIENGAVSLDLRCLMALAVRE